MLDKIKRIKYSRLSDEERFFIDTIDGIEPFISTDFPKSVFWVKNSTILLEHDFKNNFLRVNYELIWSIFEKEYGYNYTNTQSLIKEIVDKHTNFESLIPLQQYPIDRYNGDRKLSTFIPQITINKSVDSVGKYIKFISLTPTIKSKGLSPIHSDLTPIMTNVREN